MEEVISFVICLKTYTHVLKSKTVQESTNYFDPKGEFAENSICMAPSEELFE